MSPPHDEETGNAWEHERPFEPYRDEPSDADDGVESTARADAPLRGSQQRPSAEFDDLVRQLDPRWQERWAERIPPGLLKACAATVRWVKGPQPPRTYTITPIFPTVQHAPLALLDRYAPKKIQRFWLLIALYACWLFAFSIILWQSASSAQIDGKMPIRLGCAARYWNEGNGCGLNGDLCRPFANASLAFRCPADCLATEILNPHAVGDKEVVYKPLVVGGPTDRQTGFEDQVVNNAIYRGDSFICASAVHAGFIDDTQGGCGVLALTGEQSSFSKSKHHGVKSTGFDSYFPHSFGFLKDSRATCKDLRWPALAITVFFTTVLSLFVTDPAEFFWSIFIALFFHVALASDPPSLTNYYSLLSIAFGRFLPAGFCAWVTYKYTVKRSLTDLTAQFEKTIFWLGPAWVGALNNYTFDKLPLQRLTPHDLNAQPGAIPALIAVVLSIFFIALGQAWSFRVEGRMPRYLLIYTIFVLSLLLMVAMPGLSLRIHHYILALLLLPGTSFQNRPSLIYQGLLLGLFVNGIARWGFDSILQTPTELLQGAQKGTLLPAISVLGIGASNITFNLGPLPRWDKKVQATFDGISVLVNDVERFRGYAGDRDYWPDGDAGAGGNYTWTWARHRVGSDLEDDREDVNLPEYFRFGYMAGSQVGDFTKAGKWEGDGTWVDMKKGPSR
ncbi:hypothetical protein LTR37_018006 [Vermiconidia calcicola]|uniref:Uncharacterized protein n=1 Tax=Vermiconidia calcicola TaxID=1690605 RepID=A0ACC3MJ88_9PEZI|nr:hypothetical protein LTR37_018006 [Vermiconidia calcicola]